ncbi:transmembrane protein 263-B-like [Palaemon carinicauda]|uniref:transmembrane protein 263-B-like n=1 Tax=Palaemon carinicauda TaxID=392227 RepID=UPI0035B62B9B
MTSYIKGIYGYIRPGSDVNSAVPSNPSNPSSPTSPNQSPPQSPVSPSGGQLETQQQQPPAGYLSRAVSGVASGIYAVGSTTVGAGVTGVKWVAGTTYNVGAGVVGTAGTVVGTAGSVVAGTAGVVASSVGTGASAVISKVTTKKKEHTD